MTQQTATFNVSEFELRNYVDPYLSPNQTVDVTDTVTRVDSQLDFLAQMLGWNGPNYWDNLPSTVDQKRQLLGGTFGVYNSYIIPKIYEIRNWDNKIVVDQLQFLRPGLQTQIVRILLGDQLYTIQSVEIEDDFYVVGFGQLDQNFFDQIAAGVPLRADVPTYRPAPFFRPQVNASADYSFVCGKTGSTLQLFPGYDSQKQFPFSFPILFASSVYYFDQPIYFANDSSLTPTLLPQYDQDRNLWYLEMPTNLPDPAGITGYLVWAHSDSVQADNYKLAVTIIQWSDPSDWNSINVLDNFRGVWGNKGGALPFNFVFDSLSIHGFSERDSIQLNPVETSLNFDDIVNYVYYQKTVISDLAPGNPNPGDLWWNDATGALAVWLPELSACGSWLEIDYRQSPRLDLSIDFVFPDVAAFRAGQSSLAVGVVVRIDDITGLDISDNVLGVQGTLTAPGSLVLHRDSSAPYWTPDKFSYVNVSDFEADALLLPFKVPVTLFNASGLSPDSSPNYIVNNLRITVSGDYDVLLEKYYENTNWELFPDSFLKYIAYSSLFNSPEQGEMWWDFDNPDPNTRAATMYYGNAWVSVNQHPLSAPPAPTLDMGTVLFYCNGVLVRDSVSYITDDFSFTWASNPLTGKYQISYVPFTFTGKVQLPTITISDAITTTYQSDITSLVFSGITYYMSPNVYNSETPLRLWKSQDLQVAETVAHLEEDNYINPLVADLNNGPGPENWEKYFVRLPLEYGRDGTIWQKVALTCQDFAYWGSTNDPEQMRCPPEDDTPAIYEELFLYDQPIPDYTYVYCEPYLYSNVAYYNSTESGIYQNSGVYPSSDVEFDEFSEAEFVSYEPLHNRQADVTSPVNKGYGDWLGIYVNAEPCLPLTGFLDTDLENRSVLPVEAPWWDASIYKFAPTCQNEPQSYSVDANHYKIGYCYFVADASAAEDAFFDISKEASWRYPTTQPKTLYMTPR